MMGLVMPETCWAYKKYNKNKWQLVGFLFFSGAACKLFIKNVHLRIIISYVYSRKLGLNSHVIIPQCVSANKLFIIWHTVWHVYTDS